MLWLMKQWAARAHAECAYFKIKEDQIYNKQTNNKTKQNKKNSKSNTLQIYNLEQTSVCLYLSIKI